MTTNVQVELDRWSQRSHLRSACLEDESRIVIGLTTNANNKLVLDRSIDLGDYLFRVFVSEYRGETTFLVRASMAVWDARRKGRRSRRTALRERPVKPVFYASEEVHWTLDRSGVFAGFPEKWDDYWANNFIKETLDGLRSPEIPKHYELHGDNNDDDLLL